MIVAVDVGRFCFYGSGGGGGGSSGGGDVGRGIRPAGASVLSA